MNWQHNPLGQDSQAHFSWGDKFVNLRQSGESIKISTGTSEEETESELTFISTPGAEVSLKPVLPDRPLVLRPEFPVTLLPGQQINYNLPVPAWLQIRQGSQVLTEVISKQLSGTFAGDPWNGELAYAFDIPLTQHTPDSTPDWKALCSLTIKNESTALLDFQRFILRVSYLSVLLSGDQLITDGVRVSFRGQDQVSQVSFERVGVKTGATMLSPPRNTDTRNLLVKSFVFIKNLAGME